MYITGTYWENYIGDTDDSLTLVEYLAGKQKEEISVQEIFSDFGLDRLQGEFREPEEPLVFVNDEGWEMELHYAIVLITDLAALLLECKVSGGIAVRDLGVEEPDAPDVIHITATPDEHTLIHKCLMEFVAAPLTYDLSEMMPEEDMLEFAGICEKLRKELYDCPNNSSK